MNDDEVLGRSGKNLTINAGDTIRYYDPIGIFGEKMWHRSATVTEVRATVIATDDDNPVEDQISLVLHNRDCIANDTKVLVAMKATTVDGVIQRQEIPEFQCYQYIYAYDLKPGTLEGAASLRAQDLMHQKILIHDTQEKIMKCADDFWKSQGQGEELQYSSDDSSDTHKIDNNSDDADVFDDKSDTDEIDETAGGYTIETLIF